MTMTGQNSRGEKIARAATAPTAPTARVVVMTMIGSSIKQWTMIWKKLLLSKVQVVVVMVVMVVMVVTEVA
jgi:hypothetical protein